MWAYPKVIAHRGGGTLAPENTLAGIRCGLAHGFKGIEFDVMLSADKVPILMHDPQLGRTVTGKRSIANCTAQELMVMDAGSWFGPAFAGEAPPTYWQVLEFCTRHQIWMNVEIKPVPGFEFETGSVVAAETRRFLETDSALQLRRTYDKPAASLPLFSSFSLAALHAAKAEAPDIARGYLLDRVPPDWEARLQEIDAVALHTNHKYLNARKVMDIHKAGYGVFCYTVNDLARARELLSWNVDAFCTDRLDLITPDLA